MYKVTKDGVDVTHGETIEDVIINLQAVAESEKDSEGEEEKETE